MIMNIIANRSSENDNLHVHTIPSVHSRCRKIVFAGGPLTSKSYLYIWIGSESESWNENKKSKYIIDKLIDMTPAQKQQ